MINAIGITHTAASAIFQLKNNNPITIIVVEIIEPISSIRDLRSNNMTETYMEGLNKKIKTVEKNAIVLQCQYIDLSIYKQDTTNQCNRSNAELQDHLCGTYISCILLL